MKKLLLIFSILFVSFTSNSSNTEKAIWSVDNEVITLPTCPLVLKGEKINFNVVGLYNGYIIDSLLLFNVYESSNVFKVYNSNTLSYLGELLSLIDRSDEYLDMTTTGQYESGPEGIKLWVNDNEINKLKLINITKSLQEKMDVLEKEYSYEYGFRSPFFINDSNIIATHVSRIRFSISSINPSNGFQSDYFNFNNQTQIKNLQYYFKYCPALKADKTKIAYAMQNFNQVLIASTDGTLKKSVSISNPVSTSRIFKISKGDLIKYFTQISATNNQMWLLYQGLKNSELDNWDIQSPTSKIIVLDWEGKLLHQFNLNNYLISIFIDPAKNILYGIDQEENLIRYDISKYII